jgi:ubiquinone/menaquinone biosynthesis C-methylase UbiE
MRECFGQDSAGASIDFFSYLHTHYPQCHNAHALSLCCGDGSFETQLIQKGVFQKITGLEISAERIHHGSAQVNVNNLANQLNFLQQDVNQGQFGEACFDVVFAKAALHHIQNLEDAFAGMKRCLKPGGLLVAIDFFGPTRFQWSDKQLHASNWFWEHRVPPALHSNADGSQTLPITRPSLETMISMDPSEAVRSSEIMTFLESNFKVIDNFALGGTVMNLLLYGERVNRFDANDPFHNAILEEAVQYERQLLESGQLSSDFRFVVAQVKP